MDLNALISFHKRQNQERPTQESADTIDILTFISRDSSYLATAMRDLEIAKLYQELRRFHKRCETIRMICATFNLGFKNVERIIKR